MMKGSYDHGVHVRASSASRSAVAQLCWKSALRAADWARFAESPPAASNPTTTAVVTRTAEAYRPSGIGLKRYLLASNIATAQASAAVVTAGISQSQPAAACTRKA